MSFKTAVATALDALRERLYTETVRDTAERLGLLSTIRETYFVAYNWSRGDTIDVTVDGASATFHVLNYKQWRVMTRLQGSESGVAQKLLSDLRPDDVFWDVGANVGQYSCLAADILDGGAVVAFEPYPPNVEILERNVGLNRSNVDVRSVALSDSEGETTFYLVDTADAGASQGSIEREYATVDDDTTAVTVETTTGERLVQVDNVPIPDVVKMDIEGAAPAAIRGMADILRSNVRVIVVETHDNSPEVVDLLEELGFHLEYGRDRDSLPMVFGYGCQ